MKQVRLLPGTPYGSGVDVVIKNSVVDATGVDGPVLEITERLDGLGVKKLVFDGVLFNRAVPEDELETILAGETGKVRLVMCRCNNHFVVKRRSRRMSKIEKVLCVMRR